MNETTIEIPEGIESINLKLPPATPAKLTVRELVNYIYGQVCLVVKERYYRVNSLTGLKSYVEGVSDNEILSFSARSGRNLVEFIKRCPFVDTDKLLDYEPLVTGDGCNCARIVVHFDRLVEV